MPTAVEEILRWATPVLHFRRTAMRDVELAGKDDRGGRQGHDLVRVGEPRRGRVPRWRHVRRRPFAQSAHDLRARRSPPLPRRPPRPPRDADRVRGASEPAGRDRARRADRAVALEPGQRDQAHARRRAVRGDVQGLPVAVGNGGPAVRRRARVVATREARPDRRRRLRRGRDRLVAGVPDRTRGARPRSGVRAGVVARLFPELGGSLQGGRRSSSRTRMHGS